MTIGFPPPHVDEYNHVVESDDYDHHEYVVDNHGSDYENVEDDADADFQDSQ